MTSEKTVAAETNENIGCERVPNRSERTCFRGQANLGASVAQEVGNVGREKSLCAFKKGKQLSGNNFLGCFYKLFKLFPNKGENL